MGKRRSEFPTQSWVAGPTQPPPAPRFSGVFIVLQLQELCSHLAYDLLLMKSFKQIMKIQERGSQCSVISFL